MPESVSGVASQAARQAAAGSADVSAPTRAAAQQGAVNSVPPGSAGSPGGDLAPVPVQPARKASDAQAAQTPAQAAPLNRAAISAAFIERVASNREWRAALADNAQATGNCGQTWNPFCQAFDCIWGEQRPAPVGDCRIANAKRMLYTGERYDAARALAMGLVDEISDDAVSAALALRRHPCRQRSALDRRSEIHAEWIIHG